MSDVVAASLITGVVAIAGYFATYYGSKRQAETHIQSVERQTAVELAKVNAENERLRRQHQEAERQHRQGTYHHMLAVLDRMDMYATGYAPDDESAYMVTLEEFNNLVGGIHLFAPQSVRAALAGLSHEMEELGRRIARLGAAGRRFLPPRSPELSYTVRFTKAYGSRRREIIEATARLIEAMRADITREILGDSDS
jgi:hypothetical protein